MSVEPATCAECGYRWALSPGEVLDELRRAPSRYAALVAGASQVALRTRLDPSTWSAIEYLGHVSDGVEWYRARIGAVLGQPGIALEPRDWDAATAAGRFHERHVDELASRVDEACTEMGNELGRLDADQWATWGLGSADGGRRTVLDLARRAVHELEHHHLDIRRALTTC